MPQNMAATASPVSVVIAGVLQPPAYTNMPKNNSIGQKIKGTTNLLIN